MQNIKNNAAKVVVASSLNDAVRKQIESKVKKLFPECDEVVFQTDPSVVFGIQVKYKDFVYRDDFLSDIKSYKFKKK